MCLGSCSATDTPCYTGYLTSRVCSSSLAVLYKYINWLATVSYVVDVLGCINFVIPRIASSNAPRSTFPFVNPSANMSLVSTHDVTLGTLTLARSRNHATCMNRAFSAGNYLADRAKYRFMASIHSSESKAKLPDSLSPRAASVLSVPQAIS